MDKTIVIYYSNNGSNKFLAKKIAKNLNCEIEEIRPKVNIPLFFIMGINLGNKILKRNIKDYSRVILVGPIWMGNFIPPLKGFIKKHESIIKKLIFVSCCGSNFEMKDKKYGHNLVFNEVKELLKDKCIICEAFPISLVVADEFKENSDVVMKTRLTNDNFKGEIVNLFDQFIRKINS